MWVRLAQPDRAVVRKRTSFELTACEQNSGAVRQVDRARAKVDETDEVLAACEGEDGVAPPPLHWSATLVALVTLNSFMPDDGAPELAVAVPPEAEALAFGPDAEAVVLWSGLLGFCEAAFEEVMPELEPVLPDACSCPVICTSLPIMVRTAFRSPVNL